MKGLIKLGLISVIVIFIILTAMGLILPSNILVSRAIDVKTSVFEVKSYVFDLAKWQNWMADASGSNTGMVYNNNTNTLNISGTSVNLQSISDTTIVTNWKGTTNMLCTFRLIDHHTPDSVLTIQWQMEQAVKWYPWDRFASIAKDELWGGSMQKSLENLKSLVESQ